MNKRYAFYCSGNASRLLKYFEVHDCNRYLVDFIYYDGENEDIQEKLKNICNNVYLAPQVNTSFNEEILDLLTNNKIDYLFCFGAKIFKGEILLKYRNKIVNFHPSILPSFKGLNAIDRALDSNVQVLGNTAHFIDEGIDTGPIILQSLISRADFNDYEDVLGLQIEMLRRVWDILENELYNINEGRVVISKKTEKVIFFSV